MGALEKYITDVRDTKLSGEGVSELSYYPALRTLLEEVGDGLKPKVRCFMNLKNRGAGLPDGGLFTADQVRSSRRGAVATTTADGLQLSLLGGQKPARGAIEVKPPAADAHLVATSAQVLGYLEAYRQVLVTNLRDFLLLGFDDAGKPAILESCCLASTEAEFWAEAAHPRRVEQAHGPRFMEFLKRALLSTASLAAPQDLAWFLASYAREALAITESAELSALDTVRKPMEEALGVQFEGAKGEHFFRSTLVQTLFYGLFASWVMWGKEHGALADPARFEWKTAAWTLRVPVVRALFEQVATASRLGALGLVPVLDRAAAALNRVDRVAFFSRFEQHHAIQYFYEPFLEAFDPELRKELGVWYTPPEIVKYMVARVDTVLREELDVPDGLADPRVYVLDPCCGTGAYLVEVLTRISQTLEEKGADALSAGDVKKAAMDRVFGFEILPAPFVIAHMQLGLLLQNMHLPLAENERIAVYLTNALIGWESPHGRQQVLALPELEAERDAAEKVKQELPILVVLGNPPYNAFAGVSADEEGNLVEPYKEGLVKEWGIKKFNLDDLYVRFFRVAERRIAEMSKRGVVCFISNFSFLNGFSFVLMRKSLRQNFDLLCFDNLNGDSRQTGKLTPDRKPDPSVFSTDREPVGIQVGTAISLLVRKSSEPAEGKVRYRQFWGSTKKGQLLESLAGLGAHPYETVDSTAESWYRFLPADSSTPAYFEWPAITELASAPPFNGPVERRGQALFSIDLEPLTNRLRAYFDPSVSDEMIAEIYPSLMMTGNRIVGPDARRKILAKFAFEPQNIVRYPFKPLDERWCYLTNLRPLFSEPSPDLLRQRVEGNIFVITRDAADASVEGVPFFCSPHVCDYHSISGEARHFPVLLNDSRALKPGQLFDDTLLADCAAPRPNLSPSAVEYLTTIGVGDAHSPWLHVIAIGFSPRYLMENRGGVRQDWPRIPLPNSKDLLLASAELGRKVADLLDPETDVDGVTAGSLRPEIKVFGAATRVDGVNLNEGAGDLAVTAGWGHAGQGGVTMPGKGKAIARPYASEELATIGQGAEALGLSLEQALAGLGESTVDVYLNDVAYWRCVPSGVWNYTIGGYQVMKKWLSYREKALLGRDLRVEEVREVMRMARRIAAILLLQPALDANYEAVKASTWSWNPK